MCTNRPLPIAVFVAEEGGSSGGVAPVSTHQPPGKMPRKNQRGRRHAHSYDHKQHTSQPHEQQHLPQPDEQHLPGAEVAATRGSVPSVVAALFSCLTFTGTGTGGLGAVGLEAVCMGQECSIAADLGIEKEILCGISLGDG